MSTFSPAFVVEMDKESMVIYTQWDSFLAIEKNKVIPFAGKYGGNYINEISQSQEIKSVCFLSFVVPSFYQDAKIIYIHIYRRQEKQEKKKVRCMRGRGST